jgi:hypothetical protein
MLRRLAARAQCARPDSCSCWHRATRTSSPPSRIRTAPRTRHCRRTVQLTGRRARPLLTHVRLIATKTAMADCCFNATMSPTMLVNTPPHDVCGIVHTGWAGACGPCSVVPVHWAQWRWLAAVLGGSPPRSSSSGSVPDYIGDDLGHALSTPERLRPDSAWCATAYYVPR